ncbi:Gp2.5-like ssDNA binding protein and ssDNA anneal ing protein [Vibrio phage D181]
MAKTYPTMITSPFGSALWAHLVEADKKFSELGDFKVNLKVGEAEAANLIAQIQAEKEKALAFFQEEAKSEGKTPKAIAKIKLSDIDPFEEDDEEEGVIIFKFKRKAAYVKDTGEIVHFDVPLVDATGKTIADDKKPNIGNGSTIRVMAELVPYNMATSGVGVSLRLKKVQIKDLVEFGGDGPGFDAIEDGGYVPAGMDENFGAADDGGYSV